MEALLPQITRQPSRKIAMRFSERARERSRLARHDHESECDYSSDTLLGNRARGSKPIEIIDRGILVCHQRRTKDRDAENR
jgi:hypothetical protein